MNSHGSTLWYRFIEAGWGQFHALATGRGLAALWPALDDAHFPEALPAELRADLARSFPGASMSAAAAPAPVDELLTRLKRGLAHCDDLRGLPLDYGVMPQFRREVLAHLRKIPARQQQSYGDVARALGRPAAAARAVGQACAANRWAIVVPCHRLKSATGRSLGFRWGAACRQLFEQHA